MGQTVIATFKTVDQAQESVRRLVQQGIASEEVELVIPPPDPGTPLAKIVSFFGAFALPASDQGKEQDPLAIVKVHANNISEATQSAFILDRSGAVEVKAV